MSCSNHCETDWRDEAYAVIRDIQRHVLTISVSNLPSSKKHIYFNMTTLEKKDFCVELTAAGFRIVGERYDSMEKTGKYSVFETPYSMLDSLSPAYRDSFGEELFHKLNELKKARESEHERDAEQQGAGIPEEEQKKEERQKEEEKEEQKEEEEEQVGGR